LRDALYRQLPKNPPDVVLVYVEVNGTVSGKAMQSTHYIEDYFDQKTGHTAMQRTTAYSVGMVMQMIAEGSIEQRGTLRLETGITPARFIELLKQRGIRLTTSVK
jgi:lysine 6-dehydrogenase